MTAEARAVPKRPRLLSDQLRFWLALLIAPALYVGGLRVVGLVAKATGSQQVVRSHVREILITGYFGVWIAFCIVFCLLTFAAFRRVVPTQLDRWLGESARKERRRRILERISMAGGPAAAAFFCAFAFYAVIIVATHADLRTSIAVIVGAVLTVASSWLYIVVAYSTHYARMYANHRGLRFPVPDESSEASPYAGPSMSDFFYLSAQVATTFSSSDVEVVTSRLRRVVTARTLVMFTFNTVIVALLVSVLVSVAS